VLSSEHYGRPFYLTLHQFVADMRRMFGNARTYNAPDTIYFKAANRCGCCKPPDEQCMSRPFSGARLSKPPSGILLFFADFWRAGVRFIACEWFLQVGGVLHGTTEGAPLLPPLLAFQQPLTRFPCYSVAYAVMTQGIVRSLHRNLWVPTWY